MIAFTSDLHLGITSQNAIRDLGEQMRSAGPEALILGGDIGEGPEEFDRVLDLLEGVAPLKGYVPGNHDVWSRGGWSSSELLARRLPRSARERGWDVLEDTIWRLGSLAVVASMAWYDYSAIDPRFSGQDAATIAARKAEFVNDAPYVTWPWEDRELARRLREGVERRLTELDRDREIERVAVATHVPLFEEQMTRKPGDLRWGWSNAYFGHLTLGAVVARFPKVTDVVSGHTHSARDALVERSGVQRIRARVCGSHYGNPAWLPIH